MATRHLIPSSSPFKQGTRSFKRFVAKTQSTTWINRIRPKKNHHLKSSNGPAFTAVSLQDGEFLMICPQSASRITDKGRSLTISWMVQWPRSKKKPRHQSRLLALLWSEPQGILLKRRSFPPFSRCFTKIGSLRLYVLQFGLLIA